MEGNAVVRCEFGHVGDGRRADSSTRFPGPSSYELKRKTPSLWLERRLCVKIDPSSSDLTSVMLNVATLVRVQTPHIRFVVGL
jgi:hypothetical protein